MEGFESTVRNALEWKNRSLNSSRRSKRLLSLPLANGIRRFACISHSTFSSIHTEITRLRWICSESTINNWDILSSEPVSLMEDRTNRFLRKFGASAGLIREDKALDLKIEKGECSVVLSLPESFSRNWSVAN